MVLMSLIEVKSCKWKAIDCSETTNDNIHWQPLWNLRKAKQSYIFNYDLLKDTKTCLFSLYQSPGLRRDLWTHQGCSLLIFVWTDSMSSLSGCSCSRSKPAEEPVAGSSEDNSDTSWISSPPETELEDPENGPGLGDEELPHMLLPDSLSQLEEFGRHKRPRKAHRGHGRPRLFSDLWVRIGDRWVIRYDPFAIEIFSSLKKYSAAL